MPLLSEDGGIGFRIAIASLAAVLLAPGCSRDESPASSAEATAERAPAPEGDADQSPSETVSLRVLGMT